MISGRLFTVLIIGLFFMCAILVLQLKWYRVKLWKSAIVSLVIICTGLAGSELLFYIENGIWGGKSFYGAIFLSALTFFPTAKILRIPYAYALDFCATAGCLMLAILKVQCLMDGCCQGIILYTNKNYVYVRFPSQIVELIVALLLFALLLYLSYRPKHRGLLYPYTLVLYGITRFFLNLLRDDWGRMKEMHLPLPIGNIWSMISIALGIGILVAMKKLRKKHSESTLPQ